MISTIKQTHVNISTDSYLCTCIKKKYFSRHCIIELILRWDISLAETSEQLIFVNSDGAFHIRRKNVFKHSFPFVNSFGFLSFDDLINFNSSLTLFAIDCRKLVMWLSCCFSLLLLFSMLFKCAAFPSIIPLCVSQTKIACTFYSPKINFVTHNSPKVFSAPIGRIT